MIDGLTSIPLPGFRQRGGKCDAHNDRLTQVLGEFVVGPENLLVQTAVEAVTEDRAECVSPLVFHGPSGSGKSHLAWGLASAWKSRFPDRSVVCGAAVDFARALREAIETQAIDEFRRDHRRVPLLILDNIDHLATERLAQEELLHTLDRRVAAGQWVVMTTASPPGRIPEMDATLQGRLMQGLVVSLVLPTLRTRQVVLRRLAALQRIEFRDSDTRLLATQFEGPIARLSGALTRLRMFAVSRGVPLENGRPVESKLIQQFLQEKESSTPPTLAKIARSVAKQFATKVSDLRGASRCREIVLARGVAVYLTRQLTGQSFGRIGRYFGGRDHTTVLHNYRKTEQRISQEPAIRQTVVYLQQQLHCDGVHA